MKNKRLLIILGVVAALLMVPLVAMQFTDEVNWTALDFAVMGALLTTTGLILEAVLRMVANTRNRILLVSAVVAVFLVVWIELAVGIF